MLTVLFIIFLIVTIGGFILIVYGENNCAEGLWWIGNLGILIGTIVELIIIISFIYCIGDILDLTIIDDKIAMYQEENNNIEQQISEIVDNYIDYEKETNKTAMEMNTANLLILTEMYPELKSNKLVSKQIDIYVENNDKIKELKEEKLNKQVSKWWLYFRKSGGRIVF